MRVLTVYFPVLSFVALCIFVSVFDGPVQFLTNQIQDVTAYAYVMYVLLLVAAVVLMPLTVMPLIPLATSVFGPLSTALLSIIGWTLGGIIAFALARYLGRPLLSRFISLDTVDDIALMLPKNTRFFFIVALRLALPVDIVSYALGLVKSIGFFEYTMATLIGVSWFAFAFAYLGDALLQGNTPVVIELIGASLFVFAAGWFFVRRSSRKN